MKTHQPAQLALKRARSTANLPWQVCSRCGLVYTKARAAVLAARAPCSGADDPIDIQVPKA